MTARLHSTWIGVDWGTSRCRAFAFDAADQVIGKAENDSGMNSLSAERYEWALLSLVGPWLTDGDRMPVIVCGMAGARQGWREAPYRPVPCGLIGNRQEAVAVTAADPRIRVMILPGLCQSNRDAPDVMRGEETQLSGFAAREPAFDGLVCLPGTHAKWARLRNGRVESFQTFMTGELFDLLATHSILRFSTEGTTPDATAFRAAVQDAARPEAPLGARLFQIRAADLLFDSNAPAARARLSGLLIGDEIRGALAGHDSATPVGLVGDDALCDLYESALAALHFAPLRISGTEAVIEGLACAYRALATSEKDR